MHNSSNPIIMETLKQIIATIFSIAKQEVYQIIGEMMLKLLLFLINVLFD